MWDWLEYALVHTVLLQTDVSGIGTEHWGRILRHNQLIGGIQLQQATSYHACMRAVHAVRVVRAAPI